jgi:nitroimidazol reductase NimA-like FMN-containing flavoprotein (pyridoxamine 5'-phosphate oxidase superfamily)
MADPEAPPNTTKDVGTAPSERTRVKRLPNRGAYDRETLYRIVDASFSCHVGYVVDGQPYVTPTAHWRRDDYVYWHGSSASRMLRAHSAGVPVCLTVTLLDGLVLARSAFHHSMNYRSVMAIGTPQLIDDTEQKLAALHAFVERLAPGRWREIRPPTATELKATTIMRLRLDEASAKMRSGPSVEDEADYVLPCWAGVVPLTLRAGPLQPDPRLLPGTPTPPNLSTLKLA